MMTLSSDHQLVRWCLYVTGVVSAAVVAGYLVTGKYAPREMGPAAVPVVAEPEEFRPLVEEERDRVSAALAAQQRTIADLKKEVAHLKGQVRAFTAKIRQDDAQLAALNAGKQADPEPNFGITETPVRTMAQAERIKRDALRTLGPLGLDTVLLSTR